MHATVKAYYETLLEPSITKWDIFHYVYAVLHHPDYRQRYAANLRRELPHIPLVAATPNVCHPEEPSFGDEGPMHFAGTIAAANKSTGSSDREQRGPQDDNAKTYVSPVSPYIRILLYV